MEYNPEKMTIEEAIKYYDEKTKNSPNPQVHDIQLLNWLKELKNYRSINQ